MLGASRLLELPGEPVDLLDLRPPAHHIGIAVLIGGDERELGQQPVGVRRQRRDLVEILEHFAQAAGIRGGILDLLGEADEDEAADEQHHHRGGHQPEQVALRPAHVLALGLLGAGPQLVVGDHRLDHVAVADVLEILDQGLGILVAVLDLLLQAAQDHRLVFGSLIIPDPQRSDGSGGSSKQCW